MKSKAPYDVARRRVERGYNWLVTKGPTYGLDISRVETDDIRMDSHYHCVVARASARASARESYNQISRAVQGWRPSWLHNWRWGARNGFLLLSAWGRTYDRQGVTYEVLDRAWVDAINAHRKPSDVTYTPLDYLTASVN
jgi:hypothetical protein